MRTRQEFLEAQSGLIFEFCDEILQKAPIFDTIWNKLNSMQCPDLCPWCGVPCDGVVQCNDKYIQGGVPCKKDARIKHSSRYHRDPTIIGRSSGGSRRLLNLGDCHNAVRQNLKIRVWDPEKRKSIEVPYTYYETTWRIKSMEDERCGFFWKWFHAQVSICKSLSYKRIIDDVTSLHHVNM